MKRQRWASLEAMLAEHGFVKSFVEDEKLQTIWFSAKSTQDDSFTTNLRFAYKSKLQVLTMYVGWNQTATRRFVIRALKEAWPSGLEWISETGLLHTPAMLLFNLADQMGWRFAGMPVGGDDLDFEKTLVQLNEVSVIDKCRLESIQSLLYCYLDDIKPFSWRNSNSAIRVAEIAGLLHSLGADFSCFDLAVRERINLIDGDMFGLGSAEPWTKSLRAIALSDA